VSGAALARLHLGGALAIGQFIGRGALALALLLLVRELTPQDFSTFVLALAIVAILGTVADAGFSRLLVRDTARAGAASGALVRDLIRVRMIAVATTALFAALALALGAGPFETGFAALVVVYLTLESVALGYENAAAGAERPWRFVVAQSGAAIVLLGGLVVLVQEGGVTLTTAMAVLVGASAVKVGGHLFAWRTRASRTDGAGSREKAATLFRQALPFLGLTLISTVYYKAGMVSLYALEGASEAASYAAALRVVDAVALLAVVVFLSVSPTFSRMHRDQPQEVWPTWRRMVVAVSCVALPCAVVVGVVAQPLCALLFGDQYRVSAAEDLRLMLPGVALLAVQAVSAAVVFMSDAHRDALLLGLFNLAVCLAAAVGFSAAFGSSGAAFALSLAELVSFASFTWLIRRRYGTPRPTSRALRLRQRARF